MHNLGSTPMYPFWFCPTCGRLNEVTYKLVCPMCGEPVPKSHVIDNGPENMKLELFYPGDELCARLTHPWGMALDLGFEGPPLNTSFFVMETRPSDEIIVDHKNARPGIALRYIINRSGDIEQQIIVKSPEAFKNVCVLLYGAYDYIVEDGQGLSVREPRTVKHSLRRPTEDELKEPGLEASTVVIDESYSLGVERFHLDVPIVYDQLGSTIVCKFITEETSLYADNQLYHRTAKIRYEIDETFLATAKYPITIS